VRHYGHCLTLRLDNADLRPDLSACRHVIGYDVQPQGVYISLSPGQEEALVVTAPAPPLEPVHVRRAAGWIQGFNPTGQSVEFTYRGWGSGSVELAGLPPGQRVSLQGPLGGNRRETADGRGRLTINPAANGFYRVVWP
jgi:hypothetical protein